MKRYNITSEATSIVVGDVSARAKTRIRVTEADDGKWVKYEKISELLRSLLYLSRIGSVECQYMEGVDLCEFAPDPKFLKEALK